MENNKKIFDAQGNEVNLTSQDFEFCQVDKKIHDTKFETKATTFAKDAFKRFCKNKSSVVATFIIGILVVLAIFVPIFNTHDVEKPNLSQRLLEPKLFETGTGFWDGTREVSNIPYDPKTDGPAGYNANAVVKVLATREVIADTYSQFAHGGTYVYEMDDLGARGYDYLQHVSKIQYTKDNDISLNIEFADQYNILEQLKNNPNPISYYLKDKNKLIIFIIVMSSFLFELEQSITCIGGCDGSDFAMNVIGGIIGVILFRLFNKLNDKKIFYINIVALIIFLPLAVYSIVNTIINFDLYLL